MGATPRDNVLHGPVAQDKKISRRKLIKRAILGTVAVTAVDAFGIEPRWLDVESETIPIRGLGKPLDGYRIAMLSDFHIPRTSKEFVRQAWEHASAFKPDLVAVPGDFVHGHSRFFGPKSGGVPSFRGYFEAFDAPDGVLATLGNHDHWLDAPGVKAELAKHSRMQLVENTHVMIERGGAKLAVGGVGDLWMGYVVPEKAFAGVPDDVPRIMLSHNPDVAEDMKAAVRIDLQLSGHTHGGEVRFPFGPAPIIPSKYGNKFRAGLCEGKHHRVYVTKGLVSVCRARFFCRPEVTLLTLRSA